MLLKSPHLKIIQFLIVTNDGILCNIVSDTVFLFKTYSDWDAAEEMTQFFMSWNEVNMMWNVSVEVIWGKTLVAISLRYNLLLECDIGSIFGKMNFLRWMIPPMVVHPEKIDFRRFV